MSDKAGLCLKKTGEAKTTWLWRNKFLWLVRNWQRLSTGSPETEKLGTMGDASREAGTLGDAGPWALGGPGIVL